MNKKLLLILMLVIGALSVGAQNVSVVSCKYDENDQTANLQGTMVMDQNGEKCALLRIQTTQTGFSFDVGTLGVTKVVQKTGEVWVYVPHGVRRITIRHQQLGTAEYAFPIYIERAKTYVVELTTGEVHTVVTQAVTSQYVLFRLTPPNAIVELDGQMLETTDGTAYKRMPFGSYSYRVQAPRYASEVGTVKVNDPNNKHIVDVKLQPQFTTVTLSSPVSQAEIWVNEQKKGVGQCNLELAYGTYMVECRLAGHRPSQQEINISAQQANSTITLQAPTPIYGNIDIQSSPADAEVWIGDKKMGTTPTTLQTLVGSYKVVLKKTGYKSLTKDVEVTEGQTSDLSFTLEKGFSSDGVTYTVNGVTFKMIPVEGGTFQMGATGEQGSEAFDDEKPVHNVSLSGYSIGQTEVTQALWKAVMGNNPSKFKGDDLPVERVSWNNCQEFITKLNALTGKQFRLPTEAEWEYACRGGNKSKGYKYSGSNTISDVAWYGSNSNSKTHPVATKQPNELGIYDMSGNVWEWCQDRYGGYSSDSQINPTGPDSGAIRVIRGGSWNFVAWICRSSGRNNGYPVYSRNNLGLRLVLP